MLKEQARLLNRLTIAADLSLVVLSFYAAYCLRRDFLPGEVGAIKEYSWILLPAIPAWYYLLVKYKLYSSIRQLSVSELVYRIFSAHFFLGIILSALVLFFVVAMIMQSRWTKGRNE